LRHSTLTFSFIELLSQLSCTVGQVGGNIGDGINQARTMAKIRRNMEELEKVIAACAQQEPKLLSVDTKLVGMMATLKEEVFTEEKRILEGVIEAAKAAAQAGA
jgi:hypothetical protein